MVDHNLIQQIGLDDSEVDSLLKNAYGDDVAAGDTEIRDLEAAGLSRPSRVRLKLFTLDARLVLRRAGRLERTDRDRVRAALREHLVG